MLNYWKTLLHLAMKVKQHSIVFTEYFNVQWLQMLLDAFNIINYWDRERERERDRKKTTTNHTIYEFQNKGWEKMCVFFKATAHQVKCQWNDFKQSHADIKNEMCTECEANKMCVPAVDANALTKIPVTHFIQTANGSTKILRMKPGVHVKNVQIIRKSCATWCCMLIAWISHWKLLLNLHPSTQKNVTQ